MKECGLFTKTSHCTRLPTVRIWRIASYLPPYPNSEALWRYGWPPLCMTGVVGNTLVLLVRRRDALVRTSANVYLSRR